MARTETKFKGYLRPDGSKGVRNFVAVAYTVYCAEHVARQIVEPFRTSNVQLIGFDQCYPSDYGFSLIKSLTTHSNVGAVLMVSLGCEEFRRSELKEAVAASGRPVEALVVQEVGGTVKSIDQGRRWVEEALIRLSSVKKVPMTLADLIVGLECGGSDAFSGITANPAVGRFVDWLVKAGGTAIFEETNELFGCEFHLASRARIPEVAREVIRVINKAVEYYSRLGHASFGGGNITGGLSTIEEKSAGAYAKSGTRPLDGVLTPGVRPPGPGLYLLDTVYDSDLRHGIPNIHDPHTVTTLTSCGCHLILFTTGCGSVVGQAVSPAIKICSNTDVFQRMQDDMDVNAGWIIEGRAGLDDIAQEIIRVVLETAGGRPSRSEKLGHQEMYVSDGFFQQRPAACRGVR